MFLADGGPDFNPSHLVNALFYYRLFKKLDADILDVMTYAARYSAFNPIEHLWAPLSNRLSGVVFSQTIEGETGAPAQQSSLDEASLIEKERVVFDTAMKNIRDDHWNDFEFDNFEMNLDIVECNHDQLLFNDYKQAKAAMKSGIRNLHNHSSIINEFKEMHKHADRHLNEIIFTKCNDKTCCKTFRSEMVRDHFNGKVKFPSPSISKNGHYNTFFQECINQQKRYGDVGQPTAVEKQLGVCDFCPSFAFKSKTEKEKHNGIFHRRQKLPARKPNDKLFKCIFEGCAETFHSLVSLSRHQPAQKHRKRDQV